MTTVPSLFSLDTLYCADSVEFCPNPELSNILVCGTYELQRSEETGDGPTHQRRMGRYYVYEADQNGSLLQLQQADMPAILDMKWSHHYVKDTSECILAIADAEGRVTFKQWSGSQRNLSLVQSLQTTDTNTLCLSLDWSNRLRSQSADTLITSLSDGHLAFITQGSTGEYQVSQTWHAHDFEPWIAAWDYWHPSVAFSGGDDCKLKGWDVRAGYQPTFVNKRFTAGVTTIQSNPHIEHLVAVGSYDSTVRLFDARKPTAFVSEADIGGGAWRVKWHSSFNRKSDLLVACMHDGFKVLRFNNSSLGSPTWNDVPYELLERFDAHKSLAYGVDWSCIEQTDSKTLVASCSFYDHILHMWTSNA